MSKLTVQSLIDAGLHTLVNLCEDDPRFYTLINSFQSRALAYGRWWGTVQMLDACVSASGTCTTEGACVIMPREVAVIEALTLNGAPLNPRNAWYSYITPVDPTYCGSANCSPGLYPWGRDWQRGPWGVSEDKLTVPSFGVTTTGQTIRLYFNSADLGKKVRVQGYDENNVWVRTSIDGTVQDGEQVTLATTGGEYYTDTTTVWRIGSPQAIIKEATSYNVLMFAVDEDGTVAQQLANYQPTELLPSYRKFYLPGRICGCSDNTATLRCLVSLAHVPVSTPTDWLLFDDALPAYEDGVQAAHYWRNGDRAQGDAYFFGFPRPAKNGRGVLRHAEGAGALPTLRTVLRKSTADLTTVQVRRSGVMLPRVFV